MTHPLVSIGIPTYNRAALLEHALGSALGQTYEHLEVVVSDNASTDDTEWVLHARARHDPRLRIVRQPENRGLTANFNAVYEAVRGDYVLLLSDDDWLDRDYVERCVAELEADPGLAVVAGAYRSFRHDGTDAGRGTVLQLEQEDAGARISAYLAQATHASLFYGVMRAAAVERAAPKRNVLANDWLFTAAVLVTGRGRTLTTTEYHRRLDGSSRSIADLADTLAVSGLQARAPHLVIARSVVEDIGWRHPAYAPLGRVRRLMVAARCAAAVIDWTSLAFHLLAPTIVRLSHRPRLAWAATALQRARERNNR